MLENIEIIEPERIEERSMQIIASEMDAGRLSFYSEEELRIVKRCIHTAADFDYQYNLIFTQDAVKKGKQAIQKGAIIVTDTSMAMAGINKRSLERFGSSVHCFIGDAKVEQEAKEKRTTRASICMDYAAKKFAGRDLIFVIGNAPTALIRLYELIAEGLRPELIIGAPVGFVNVVESKELILQTDIPAIVARGRKGGSNISAAIVNAIVYQTEKI